MPESLTNLNVHITPPLSSSNALLVMVDRSNDSHLLTKRQMLFYFSSMNHTNYIRGVALQDTLKLLSEVLYDMKRGMAYV